MKRVVLAIVVIVILALGGAVYYLLSSLDGLVKSAIERYGSEMTGTAVRVDSVRIDVAAGRGTIRGLTIANPPGYTSPQAFRLDEITLGIDTSSLTGSPVRIDEISIRGPETTYELTAEGRANLGVIHRNLTNYAGEGTSQAGGEEDGAETRLVIRKLVFEKGVVAARTSAIGGRDKDVNLPPLQMSDLGGAKGMTGADIAQKVMTQYTQQVIRTVTASQAGRLIDKKLGGEEGEAAKRLLNKVLQ